MSPVGNSPKPWANIGANILTRQRGSHMRYTTQLHGEHHAAIPDHNPMRLGTLSGILKDIAEHHGLTVEELARKLKL
jgi:hypothetical protein